MKEMKTIKEDYSISEIIRLEYIDSDFCHYDLFVEDENNNFVNLGMFILEKILSFSQKNSVNRSFVRMSGNYYIYKDKTEDIELKFLKKLYGGLSYGHHTEEIQYSEWTSDTMEETILTIGNHNLFRELSSKVGKFIKFNFSLKLLE